MLNDVVTLDHLHSFHFNQASNHGRHYLEQDADPKPPKEGDPSWVSCLLLHEWNEVAVIKGHGDEHESVAKLPRDADFDQLLCLALQRGCLLVPRWCWGSKSPTR